MRTMKNASSPPRRGSIPVLGALVLATLLLLVLPTGFAAASAPPAADSQTLWAYGAVKTVTFQGSSFHWQYSGTGTYGYSVVLNQTNTSATSFELSANRTMGALFEVTYCYPSCSAPVYYGNESYHVYETIVSNAVLTTVGSVDEGGIPVPALALNSSESHLRANATETATSFLPMAHVVALRSHYLSANVVANSSVTFTPGLGLLPIDLTSAQSWNSSSQYVAHVGASYAYYGAASGAHGSGHVGPVTGNFSVPSSGTVSLTGNYSPSRTVDLGNVPYPEISLRVVGPFTVREGFILLPSVADLFGGGAQPWAAQQNGSATASMSYLDARIADGSHLGIAASQWVYDSSTMNPNATPPMTSGGSGLSPSVSGGADSAPATTVQGQPETVASAQSQQSCLLTGTGCPSGSTGPAPLRGIVGLLAVGVVVVVVIAAVVLVAERRRMPPPAYPNAALYPPGTVAPRARAPPLTPPAPAEEDPLRNLW